MIPRKSLALLLLACLAGAFAGAASGDEPFAPGPDVGSVMDWASPFSSGSFDSLTAALDDVAATHGALGPEFQGEFNRANLIPSFAPAPLIDRGWGVDPEATNPVIRLVQATEDLPGAGTGGDISLRGMRQGSTAGTIGGLVGQGEARTRPSSDAGALLGGSTNIVGVAAQRRNPVVTDVRTRGNHVGQLLASGSYWMPVRMDLDTLLNKIDSRLVQDMIVIKGPYSVRQGPGFNFVNFSLLPTPRYSDGSEGHGSTSFDYKTNGQQWYGRQSVWAGSDDWGVRTSYGHRTANDYRDGSGRELPSSYNSRDVDFALGYDPTSDSRLEFNFLRLDQTHVEFPSQVFDIDVLVTDAHEIAYEINDQPYFDQLKMEVWWNRTRFAGNANRPGKRRQIPQLNDSFGDAFTDGDLTSTGFTLATSWGDEETVQHTIGADLRFINQQLTEQLDLTAVAGNDLFNRQIPRSYSANPGVFVETSNQYSDRLRVTAGARADVARTQAVDHYPQFPDSGIIVRLEDFLGEAVRQTFSMASAYVTTDYALNSHWNATGGVGYARRLPTLTELYSDRVNISILQGARGQLLGNPGLQAPTMIQFDLGLKGEFDSFRFGINGFHAWVKDYITLQGFAGNQDLGQTANFINTDLATLAGGEVIGEVDYNPWVTLYSTLSYVEGRDHTRSVSKSNQTVLDLFGIAPGLPRGQTQFVGGVGGGDEEPLPGIEPLVAVAGIRLHDPHQQRWSVELFARIVDNQDRVAESLNELPTPGFAIYNLRAYWRATDHLLLIGGVENFTDKFYREHLDIRSGLGTFQPGVNAYFGSELTY